MKRLLLVLLLTLSASAHADYQKYAFVVDTLNTPSPSIAPYLRSFFPPLLGRLSVTIDGPAFLHFGTFSIPPVPPTVSGVSQAEFFAGLPEFEPHRYMLDVPFYGLYSGGFAVEPDLDGLRGTFAYNNTISDVRMSGDGLLWSGNVGSDAMPARADFTGRWFEVSEPGVLVLIIMGFLTMIWLRWDLKPTIK